MSVHALARAIDACLTGVSGHALQQAGRSLRARYRGGDHDRSALVREPPRLSDLERLAYVATRMPATYAALHRVLAELAARQLVAPAHVLDLGSGPGTTAWVVRDLWPSASVTLVERDPAFAALGERLWEGRADRGGEAPEPRWDVADLARLTEFPPADLVVCAYALGELRTADATRVVAHAHGAAPAVVVIEPGSPRGYGVVLTARHQLIDAGAHVAAPCPHDRACPLPDGEWCHMTARLERSRLHRFVEGSSLSYEDEPFSYVVTVQAPLARRLARVIERPRVHKGHIALRVCGDAGVGTRVVTRSQRAAYREARHVKWGSALRDAEPADEADAAR